MLYSDRLIYLREQKNLTIHNISDILNLEKDTYGKYEREYVIIPIKHLNTVCNYFNVSLDYIFKFTNKLNYDNNIKNINCKISGQRLKSFRKEQNLTQANLANFLNIERSVIANYESGKNIIATPFLYAICKKYNLSADYLLGKIDTPKYLK